MEMASVSSPAAVDDGSRHQPTADRIREDGGAALIGVRQDGQEAVAADPTQGIGHAHPQPEPQRQLAQHLVGHGQAVVMVQLGEAVDVDQHGSHRMA